MVEGLLWVGSRASSTAGIEKSETRQRPALTGYFFRSKLHFKNDD